MGKFYYRAKKTPDQIIDGFIEAETSDSAVTRIIQKGYVPFDISSSVCLKTNFTPHAINIFPQNVSTTQLTSFTRQLADLLDAGLPLLKTLNVIIRQSRPNYFCRMIEAIYAAIKGGASFSEALEVFPNVFSHLYIQMIRCGELGGQLHLSLGRLARMLEKKEDLKKQVRSALIYPAIILVLGMTTLLVMFIFVIPKLVLLLEDFDQELPLLTRSLVFLTNSLIRYWWVIGILLFAGIILTRKIRKSADYKSKFHELCLKVPYLGKIIREQELARLSLTLGMLLESGVMIVPALRIAIDTLQNEIIKKKFDGVVDQVVKGLSLKDVLEQNESFSQGMIALIGVGEESGRLEKAFLKVSTVYEASCTESIKLLTSLLEPGLILLVGGLIGFMVIALLLPIFRLNLIIN